jgi:hypothetical protein
MDQSDWEVIRRFARSDSRPDEWPTETQAISQKGLSLLGIDRENRLYWDGKRIPTLSLTRSQKIAAWILGLATIIAAIGAAASAAAAWYVILTK